MENKEKSLAEELLATLGEEQISALITLGMHTANTIHELNNPLNALLANIHILKDYQKALQALWSWTKALHLDKKQQGKFAQLCAHEDLEETFRDLPELIENCSIAAERTVEISAAMRSLARGNTGEPELIELRSLFEKNAKVASCLLKTPGRVRVEGRRQYTKGSAAWLNQIAMNLIANALQADEAGELPVVVTIADAGEKVTVTIADRGPGLEPGMAEQLFRPFATTKGSRGMGLGLYLSRKLAERMGGALLLASIGTQGTTATLTLPRETP